MNYQTDYIKRYMAKNVKPAGSLQHNLANEDDYQFVLERLGGEHRIRSKYPELYKIIRYTQRQAQSGNLPGRGRETPYGQDSEYIDLQNSMKIRTLNYDPATTLSTASSSDFIEKNPSLIIVGDVADVANNKSFDGFAVYENDAHHLDGKSIINSSALIKSTTREYRATSTFSYLQYDQYGEPCYFSRTERSDAVKVQAAGTLVKEITVNDPDSIKHPSAAQTVIYYNRSGSGCDYSYSDVSITETDIGVHIPFKGSVQFSDSFYPSYVDKNNNFMLQIENINNGVAQFNTIHWGDIKWAASGTTLSWEFPDNWYSMLAKNNLTAANNVNFYCKMYVALTNNLSIPIVIQSDGDDSADPSYKKIKPLQILWGCFGKGTKIKMADGSVKSIEDVRAGDIVAAKDSRAAKVRDIVMGTEERMVYIETSRGNNILLTSDHPVLTDEGMVLAAELTAGSKLEMEYGTDSIEALYLRQYGDRVFNLSLETAGVICANGFYTGDLAGQNEARRHNKPNEPKPKKLEAFQEEIADLITSLNESGGRQNG